MALDLGMGEGGAEQVAIATTEACTNLLKHAGGGQLLLQASTEGSEAVPLLELIALDQGPGMSDLEQCLKDGFSTGKGMGLGLGGAKRLSNEFSIHSKPGEGTKIVIARWK